MKRLWFALLTATVSTAAMAGGDPPKPSSINLNSSRSNVASERVLTQQGRATDDQSKTTDGCNNKLTIQPEKGRAARDGVKDHGCNSSDEKVKPGSGQAQSGLLNRAGQVGPSRQSPAATPPVQDFRTR
jgi:hypothetical protein